MSVHERCQDKSVLMLKDEKLFGRKILTHLIIRLIVLKLFLGK